MPALIQALSPSRYLSRLAEAQPALAAEVATRWSEPLSTDQLRAWLNAQTLNEETLKPVLRRMKQRAYLHIAARDLAGLAPLEEVTEGMTLIAELAVTTALDVLSGGLATRHGLPRNAAGEVQQLIVVGMGKLGGRELNVSSDIDLIFIYPEDGETSADLSGDVGKTGEDATGGSGGIRPISNFEFFTRLGRQLINAIADVTEHGQVFRVDMRLRPNGDSGPLVCSFEMLENYFITQGREWERYAWIKARPLSGTCLDELEAIRRPFVFRKYLDYGTINAMRELHAQIRREVERKDMADNVKLGPGGIREIEFIAQVFQLIRGGRDQSLQVKPTCQVLARLAERGLLPSDVCASLTEAYAFLRKVEHRLQYLDDAQTHNLPARSEDQATVAASMGLPDYAALLVCLDDYRTLVSRHFHAVFDDPNREEHSLDAVWQTAADDGVCGNRLAALGYKDAEAAAQRLAQMKKSSRYQQLSTDGRARIDVLVPRLVEVATTTADPDATLARGLDLLEVISRRSAYLALLEQYPQALEKVAQVIGSASWAAQYLRDHPILLDELLDPRLMELKPDWQAFHAELTRMLDDVEPDTERQMDLMREAHHAQVFRVLTQDLSGLYTVEKLSDHLSALADIMLEEAVRLVWKKLLTRHRDDPQFAVIAYGKLGGKELGYSSDLDLVFLFDDEAPNAGEIYSRLGTRVNTWLSAQTPAGHLFETDLRLRPNGESGLVVSSMEAFRKYQQESAWIWEHQALTRARFAAGNKRIGEAFEQTRIEILRTPRDREVLRAEVLGMRQKMLDTHASKGLGKEVFDIKHDPGGLIDVEFIVQYLILAHAHEFAELTGNLGNIALLKIAAELGLIPAGLADEVREAYREYRRRQHALRLNGDRPRVPPAEVAAHIAAVRSLWKLVFSEK
ncbi:MAG TPA: bifunctional [glutamate--ammonia ligase]-adenylyl-L-tyrosine phosphorylase/[glutamate--ammonia-ligase] adenylyltransferase [Roseateles sp.]|nr:bifunctional [glutamate--ammonia ligase]-adenylyl-L-tyrosine phosphorylase/[glutamate--ammonia-ligase] adenylyltransferase [Roseateles sp.]